jgi:hypothetical protein
MPPEASGPAYPLLYPPLNADGNPIGGIEVPEVAVPIATFSGRNTRAEGFSPGELCGLSGSYIPFAATKQERQSNGDPRPSLEERYADHATYVDHVRRAAEALKNERLLLDEDVQRYVAAAQNASVP